MNAIPLIRCAGRRGGFTLIEAILAIVLVAGLMMALFAMYTHAMDVRDAVMARSSQAAANRRVMDRLTNELRSAMVYPLLHEDPDTGESWMTTGVIGGVGEISFVTARLPGPAAWVVRNMTEQPVPPEPDVELVTYRVRWSEAEDDPEPVKGLERVSRKVLASRADEDNATSVLLSPQVKFVMFRYFNGEEYVGTWESNDLPLAVEIILGSEPLPADVEPEDLVDVSLDEFRAIYPYSVQRRVIFVPGGLKAMGGPVQGRPGQGDRL